MQEKVTPDSQKSTMDKASESVSQTGDKLAGAVQPSMSHPFSCFAIASHRRYTNVFLEDSEKSTTQKMSDSTRSGADDAQGEGKSMLQSAQDTVSGAASSVSDTLSGIVPNLLSQLPYPYSPRSRCG